MADTREAAAAATTDKFDQRGTKIEWIRCKDISVIWAQAQRPYNEKHARKIAEEFDPDMFDPIKVTLPNGKGVYHAVDGQHRKSAVEILWGPHEKVPCEILDADSPARAAELFVAINSNRRPLQPVHLFLARVTAGGEMQTAINKIVKTLGYRVGNVARSQQGEHLYISAVGAMEGIYRQYSPEVLMLTLKALQEIWGADPNATSAQLIRGFGAFLGEYHKVVDKDRLREQISGKFTPGQLVALGRQYKESHMIDLPEAIKAVITLNYNRGRHKNLLGEKK